MLFGDACAQGPDSALAADPDGMQCTRRAASIACGSGCCVATLSGRIGELYQSVTTLHSKPIHEGPYSHSVCDREMGSPSISITSSAFMPIFTVARERGAACVFTAPTPSDGVSESSGAALSLRRYIRTEV